MSPGFAHILSDIAVLLHFSFVLFVVIGALLLLKWPKLIWLHLPCLIWGITIEITGWICPLTYLENHLRILAGLEMYSGGFMNKYIMPILYPPSLTRNIQIVYGLAITVLNISIYYYLYRKYKAAKK